jgi:GNAT superfamily N-acetyltransferase
VKLEVVDWSDPRAVALRDAMNAETGAMYAVFTASRTAEQVAAVDDALAVDPATIVYTVIATDGGVPVGHAALRPFGAPHSHDRPTASRRADTGERGPKLEVKKVFTTDSARGSGVATALLADLEGYARGHGVTSLVLQTGPLQKAAIALYLKLGYEPIPPFGKYGVIRGALCYEKQL